MITRRLALISGTSLGISTFWAPPVLAHKLRTTLTSVVWKPEKSTLDITHSFHIHEAENALFETGRISKPDMTKLKARALLALYVADHFTLALNTQKRLDLDIIGAEIIGSYVNVYQQAKLTSAPDHLIVSCDLFREIYLDQINNVDVDLNGEIQSLSFKGDGGPKKVSS